jgi:hypothetical protein
LGKTVHCIVWGKEIVVVLIYLEPGLIPQPHITGDLNVVFSE